MKVKLQTQEQLALAFKQLFQFSTAWELVDQWLQDRCFYNNTTKVDGDPLTTYANESLRELYLEMKALAEQGVNMHPEPHGAQPEQEE